MDNSVLCKLLLYLSDCHIDHSIHQRLELKMNRMIKIMERDEIPLFDLYDSNSVSDDIKSFLENYAKSN